MSDIEEVDPISAAIAAIDEQMERLNIARSALEGIRGRTGNTPSTTAASRVATADHLNFPHDAFFGMTVGDAARKYLTARKKTASANAIGEALVAGGWKTTSKNIGENIRAILGRHEDFVKINGEFGLAQWYPGRKGATKPQPRPTTAQQPGGEETPEDILRAPGGDVMP